MDPSYKVIIKSVKKKSEHIINPDPNLSDGINAKLDQYHGQSGIRRNIESLFYHVRSKLLI